MITEWYQLYNDHVNREDFVQKMLEGIEGLDKESLMKASVKMFFMSILEPLGYVPTSEQFVELVNRRIAKELADI